MPNVKRRCGNVATTLSDQWYVKICWFAAKAIARETVHDPMAQKQVHTTISRNGVRFLTISLSYFRVAGFNGIVFLTF
jgi:hypothetical protein